MGYGAVVPDGYGVSYNLLNDVIIFCVASYFSFLETSSIRFAHTLQGPMLLNFFFFVTNEMNGPDMLEHLFLASFSRLPRFQ
jgi:hypothetical protein